MLLCFALFVRHSCSIYFSLQILFFIILSRDCLHLQPSPPIPPRSAQNISLSSPSHLCLSCLSQLCLQLTAHRDFHQEAGSSIPTAGPMHGFVWWPQKPLNMVLKYQGIGVLNITRMDPFIFYHFFKNELVSSFIGKLGLSFVYYSTWPASHPSLTVISALN